MGAQGTGDKTSDLYICAAKNRRSPFTGVSERSSLKLLNFFRVPWRRNDTHSFRFHAADMLLPLAVPSSATNIRRFRLRLLPEIGYPLHLPMTFSHFKTHSKFLQRICSSLDLPDGAVYDLYAKLRDLPPQPPEHHTHTAALSDDSVVIVNGSGNVQAGAPRGEVGGGSRSSGEAIGEAGTATATVTFPTAAAVFPE